MNRSGTADLRLSGGKIPPWLFSRMKQLCVPIVESIIQENGVNDFLARLSNPYWFQSLAAVIGMDWNSSGVTTAVLCVLKQSLNPLSKDFGLYICGGKGKQSLKTPNELLKVGDETGLDGQYLAYCSKLSAKVDSTAIQDGYNLYLHNFLVNEKGDWTVIQQGMNEKDSSARRYHWHSKNIRSFVEEPHTAICGENQGEILNLVDINAGPTKQSILNLLKENPNKIINEIPKLKLSKYSDVKAQDVDLKRLGSVLWLAQEHKSERFEDALMLKGLGPRTLQSLTLISEVIYGTPSRFSDPARFSFAFGGKSGKPFPVPTNVYDESITALKSAVSNSRIGLNDKKRAIEKLHKIAERAENNFTPKSDFNKVIERERSQSWKYGGKSIHRSERKKSVQLNLFENNNK